MANEEPKPLAAPGVETERTCPEHGSFAVGDSYYCFQCGRPTDLTPVPKKECPRCKVVYTTFIPLYCGN